MALKSFAHGLVTAVVKKTSTIIQSEHDFNFVDFFRDIFLHFVPQPEDLWILKVRCICCRS